MPLSPNTPFCPSEMTVASLQECLAPVLKGATISSINVRPLGGVDGFGGDLLKVDLGYDKGKLGPVSSFIAKITSEEAARANKEAGMRGELAGPADPGRMEVAFYESGAWTLSGIRVPAPLFAASHPDGRFVVFLEDLSPAVAGDQYTGETPEQARAVVDSIAMLHAKYWNCVRSYGDAAKAFRRSATGGHVSFPQNAESHSQDLLASLPRFGAESAKAGFTIPEATVHVIESFLKAMPQWPLFAGFIENGGSTHSTLCHGDLRASNHLWGCVPSALDGYRGVTGGALGLGLVDFQLARENPGEWDVSYCLVESLAIETRRTHECSLITAYHAALLSHGVPAHYSLLQSFSAYQESILNLVPLQMMLVRSGTLASARGNKLLALMNERLCVAIDDWKCADWLALRLSAKRSGGLDNAVSYPPLTAEQMYSVLPLTAQSKLAELRSLCTLSSGTSRVLQQPLRVPSGHTLKMDLFGCHDHGSAIHDADEYCHFTPGSLAAMDVTDQPNAYDRWFLNGYDQSASGVFFAAAFGTYPGSGREVVDGSFSVIADGIQYNLRASRHLSGSEWSANASLPPQTVCGPIRITVLKPLVQVRLTVSSLDSGSGLSCDLTFTARSEAVREPLFSSQIAGQKIEYTRLTQLVEWEGSITLPTGRVVTVHRFWGVRDRSWGIRPLSTVDFARAKMMEKLDSPLVRKVAGEKAVKQTTLQERKKMSFYWVWSPINLQNMGVLYHNQQSEGGATLENAQAQMVPLVDSSFALRQIPTLRRAGHEVVYKSDSRHAAHCRITLEGEDVDKPLQLHLQPTGINFYMSGIGYGHPVWGHGARHAQPLEVAEDKIVLAAVDEMSPLYNHIQALCVVQVEKQEGEGRTLLQALGVTSLEQLVAGAHLQSGFQHAFDASKASMGQIGASDNGQMRAGQDPKLVYSRM